MGGLIEAVLGGLLVGIFTLLGVWVAGLQERKRAREAREADREADKEKMLYEKQLEVLEEAVKYLAFMNTEGKEFIAVHEKLEVIEPSEERSATRKKLKVILQKMRRIVEESREMEAKISTYLLLETAEAFNGYSVQAIASMEEMLERLGRGEDGDVEGTKERLDVAYKASVLKMRGHLGIRESIGTEATRIGDRRRLKLKFWDSGRTGEPFSRPKS